MRSEIARYQHPMMARVRELEASLRAALDAQLKAELEVFRLQWVATDLVAENRELQAKIKRDVLQPR